MYSSLLLSMFSGASAVHYVLQPDLTLKIQGKPLTKNEEVEVKNEKKNDNINNTEQQMR